MAEKQRGKLGSILFWGTSFLIIGIFTLFLLDFIGFPIWKTAQDWGNKIPVVNQFIPDSHTASDQTPADETDWKQKYDANQSVLKKRDQQLVDMEKQLTSAKNDLLVLKKSNDELQQQLQDKQTQAVQEQVKKVASVYGNITSSKAAAMIASMPLDQASLTMSQLDQELQGSILGGMKDARKAAQITLMLKDIAGLNETNQTALEAQVRQLALKQENPTDTLAATIAGMPSAQSAVLIKSMMAKNSQVAINLLKNINTTSRSQILAEIAKTDDKLAANIAAQLNN